jgi:hypothetical protein
MMEGALFAIAAFLAAIFFARRARRNTHLLHKYEQCMSVFVASSETLIGADETPPEVVGLIQFFSEKASNPRGAREFLWVFLRYRNELASGPSNQTAAAIASLKKANPELGRVFTRAMASGMIALTYKGGIVGTFIRHTLLFDAKQHEDRSQDLAASFHDIECAQAA